MYARYALGGAIACGVTHGVLTPVDVVKTRIQLSPEKYSAGMGAAFRTIVAEEGAAALLTGVGPTFAGYALQGSLKFGLYEIFKKVYTGMAGDRASELRSAIYLGGSATAEFFADLALCPMEAVRIRMVSQPDFASSLPAGVKRIVAEEGFAGLYKGLLPILFKQIPYTMSKFAVFELAAESVYKSLPKPKDQYSNSTQLSISLGCGVFAGAIAAVVSQPADTVLSKINKEKGAGSVASRIVKIMTELGPSKLFLGLGPRVVMVGTLTAFQFFLYDAIKVAFGIPTTAGIEKKKN